MTDAQALKEAAAFDRAQRELRWSGILLTGLENPNMPIALIAERHGATPTLVKTILNKAGVLREFDFFADSIDGRRRMAA